MLDTDNKEVSKDTSAPKRKISFDADAGEIVGITPGDIERWQPAYPAIDLQSEIARAAAWLRANPKNQKKQVERFLTNWFSRSQERAPRVESLTFDKKLAVAL